MKGDCLKLQLRWLAKRDLVHGKVHRFEHDLVESVMLGSNFVQYIQSMRLAWKKDPL